MFEPRPTRRTWRDRGCRCLLLLLGAASIWGCGGRAGLEPDEDVTGIAGQFGAGGALAAGGRGGGQSGAMMVIDSPGFGAPMTLPPCVPGFRESSAGGRECTFVHERLCYEDEVTACACACPTGGRCIIGGFLDPVGPFPVTCSRLQ